MKCARNHRVTLTMWHGADVDASCDCPSFAAREACKHVWAVLLAVDGEAAPPALRAPPRRRDRPPHRESAELRERPKREREAAAHRVAASEIHYLLDAEKARERGIALVELAVREGKEARERGARRGFRLARDEVQKLPDPRDRGALGFLFGIEMDGVPLPAGRAAAAAALLECSAFVLRPADATAFLPLLCATRRFFLRTRGRVADTPVEWDGETPWRFGLDLSAAARDGHCDVRGFYERGSERLPLAGITLSLGSVFIAGNRAFANGACGLEDWREKLLIAEPRRVAASERDKAIARWVEREPPVPLVLPGEWRVQDPAEPPRPILVVEASAAVDPAAQDHAPCRLYFDYGGRRIECGQLGTRFADRGTALIVARSAPSERQAEARLRELGAVRSAALADDSAAEAVSTAPGFRFPRTTLAAAVGLLRDEGWGVEFLEAPFRGQGRVRIEVRSGIDWFGLEGALEVDEESVPLLVVLEALRKGRARVRLRDGSSASIPDDWRPRLRLLGALGSQKGNRLRFAPAQRWALAALLSGAAGVDESTLASGETPAIAPAAGAGEVREGPAFCGVLRDYQRDGLRWLGFLQSAGLGGCLADDMGLGKTVQVLAMLDAEHGGDAAGGRPSLVVAPKSVVFNWVKEARRFTPRLAVLDYTGTGRAGDWDRISDYHLVVTSYGVLRRDLARLAETDFHYAILDESQAIKNAGSLTARAARRLRARHRLALSGTPIENHLAELWSLFEFLNPGMLGAAPAFRAIFHSRVPGDAERSLLAAALRPALLRRTKREVARELPEKTEQIVYCRMEDAQQRRYRELAKSIRSALLRRVDRDGMPSLRFHILEALLRLRQAACHPGLIDDARIDDASCKLDFLLPQLDEIVEEGHKALVYSQFTSFLAILRRRLERTAHSYEYLDGGTRNREHRIDRFQQDPRCGLFLISLKAGGLGINLTAADYVFILDPWWNPAVEAQAIDRAHRIGQMRRVFAYRLVTRDTIEEKIMHLKEQKLALADAILGAGSGILSHLTRGDLELLLS